MNDPILSDIKVGIQEKNPINVQNVGKASYKAQISLSIGDPMPARPPICAPSAGNDFGSVPAWYDIKDYIREKNLINAGNAGKDSALAPSLLSINGSTRENDPTSVRLAGNVLFKALISVGIDGSIRERNHIPVHLAGRGSASVRAWSSISGSMSHPIIPPGRRKI